MQKQRIFIMLLFFIAVATGRAWAQTAKISFYNDREFKNASGEVQHVADQATTSFKQAPTGGAKVYFLIEIINVKAITAKYRLQFAVFKKKDGAEEYAYTLDLFIPAKAGKVPFINSDFTEGSYVARLVNKDNDKEVYAENTFSVGALEKPDYKKNATLVFCKSVDDNWNAVGLTTRIKAGTCIQFLFKAKDRIFQPSMIWEIVLVKADGSQEFVNELTQNAGNDPYRFLSTDNVCEFSKPGKYRVYLFEKNTSDIHNPANDKYYGKGELIVE